MGITSQTGAAQVCAHRPAWRGRSSDPAGKGAAPHPQPGELPKGQVTVTPAWQGLKYPSVHLPLLSEPFILNTVRVQPSLSSYFK